MVCLGGQKVEAGKKKISFKRARFPQKIHISIRETEMSWRDNYRALINFSFHESISKMELLLETLRTLEVLNLSARAKLIPSKQLFRSICTILDPPGLFHKRSFLCLQSLRLENCISCSTHNNLRAIKCLSHDLKQLSNIAFRILIF